MFYLYRVAALGCMAIFYGFFFAKMIGQRKRGIVTNQMAKRYGKQDAGQAGVGGVDAGQATGTDNKGFYTELLLKLATYSIPVVEVASILLVNYSVLQAVLGLYLTIVGTVVFAIAIISMRDSWRAGVAEDDSKGRELVTGGIFRYSRNPAFLGFDLCYLGILIMFFNPVLLAFSVWGIVMFHLQILREEKYLEGLYRQKYVEYRQQTWRYAGFGNVSVDKIILYLYVVIFVWSILYFFTCIFYAGPFLSMIWIWPALAVFSAIRVKMLKLRIDGKLDIPRAAVYIYRLIFVLALGIFLYVEGNITEAMTADTQNNLDYVIVLGAGLNGKTPTKPLQLRIERAYRYMFDNENTILIASGGQGFNEDISEAQCIKDALVARGIAADRIILEDKSTSTVENLQNSFSIIGNADASVGIITNGFHEYRANMIAQDVGFMDANSVPAGTLFPVGIHYIIREFFGVIHYMFLACGIPL